MNNKSIIQKQKYLKNAVKYLSRVEVRRPLCCRAENRVQFGGQFTFMKRTSSVPAPNSQHTVQIVLEV